MSGTMMTQGAKPIKSIMSGKKQQDESAGFVANPRALRRGGAAVSAARSQKRRGLLERMAQAEVNRHWRAEIAAKSGR